MLPFVGICLSLGKCPQRHVYNGVLLGDCKPSQPDKEDLATTESCPSIYGVETPSVNPCRRLVKAPGNNPW